MHYNSIIVTSFNASIILLQSTPIDQFTLVTVHPPFGYTILLSLQISLTAVFVTVILILYIYLHSEPEVKVTSFILSLLMFAGCYLNLVYLSLLLYTNHTQHLINILRDNAIHVH